MGDELQRVQKGVTRVCMPTGQDVDDCWARPVCKNGRRCPRVVTVTVTVTLDCDCELVTVYSPGAYSMQCVLGTGKY